jgi:N-acetylmuramoyl-L-alanine amidase
VNPVLQMRRTLRPGSRSGYLVLLTVVLIVLAGCIPNSSQEASDVAVSTPATAPEQPGMTPPPPTVTATVTTVAVATSIPATETMRPDEPTRTPTAAVEEPTATVAAPAAVDATPLPDAERGPVIVLDPGHDRSSPGALGIEYQVVLHSAFIAKAALEEAGYQVYLTRTDNEMTFFDDPDLLPSNAGEMHPGYGRAYAHASKALQFDPDMVIVLHFNGHPNPDVSGIEIYYCEQGGDQNLEFAHIMRDELVAAMRSIGYEPPGTRVAEDFTVARGNRHFPSLGNVYTTENEFIENRYFGIPVVLTEPLYMTNAVELALIEDDATHVAIAHAYVRAADAWFGR